MEFMKNEKLFKIAPAILEIGKWEKKKIATIITVILSVIIYLAIGVVIYYAPDPSMNRALALSSLVLIMQSQAYGEINTPLFIPIAISLAFMGYVFVSTLLWLVLAMVCVLFILLQKKW